MRNLRARLRGPGPGIALVLMLAFPPVAGATTNTTALSGSDLEELQRLSAMDFEAAGEQLRTKPPQVCVRYLLALTQSPRAMRSQKLARQYLDLALDVSRRASLQTEEGQTLLLYALFEDSNRNLVDALTRVNAALAVFEKAKAEPWIKESLWLKGGLEHRRGALPDAVKTFDRLEKLAAGKDAAVLKAHCMEEIATIRYKMGQSDRGEERAKRALAIYEEHGEDQGIADCLKLLGNLTSGQGKHVEAIAYYRRSAEKYKEVNNIHGQANCQYNTGICYRQLERYGESVSALQEAIAAYTQSSSVTGVGIANMELGRTYLGMGDLAKSEAALVLAANLLTKSQDLWRLGQTEEVLAELRLAQGRKADAARHYRNSIEHHEAVKMTAEAKRIRGRLEKLDEANPAPESRPGIR